MMGGGILRTFVTAVNDSGRMEKLRSIAAIAVGLLFLKVFLSILIEYRWYFPADFDRSAFLSGRRDSFIGIYRMAFYTHLLAGPLALIIATYLMFSGGKHKLRKLHRTLGKLQLVLVLAILVPSGWVMAQQAYAGPIAAVGFSLLSIATGGSVLAAGYFAMRRKFQAHQRWATRCFLLLASPLLLRLVTGGAIVLQRESELFYCLNAWLSWLIPLAIHEFWWRYRTVGSMLFKSLARPAAMKV